MKKQVADKIRDYLLSDEKAVIEVYEKVNSYSEVPRNKKWKEKNDDISAYVRLLYSRGRR